MMQSTDNVPLVEEGGCEPCVNRLTIWHKVGAKCHAERTTHSRTHGYLHQILFYMLGLTSAVTICVLIRLSNKLAADAEHKAFMHFKEISQRIGHKFDN
ncbi:hypothetical protein KR222_004577 [Zaprionus bogoriensis]|nr:hypothetical protein KR222_004577 [Zaprionus bogoriensis]